MDRKPTYLILTLTKGSESVLRAPTEARAREIATEQAKRTDAWEVLVLEPSDMPLMYWNKTKGWTK